MSLSNDVRKSNEEHLLEVDARIVDIQAGRDELDEKGKALRKELAELKIARSGLCAYLQLIVDPAKRDGVKPKSATPAATESRIPKTSAQDAK